jgi:hypothetical protein
MVSVLGYLVALFLDCGLKKYHDREYVEEQRCSAHSSLLTGYREKDKEAA